MADIFDQIHSGTAPAAPAPAAGGGGDIFDQLHSQAQPQAAGQDKEKPGFWDTIKGDLGSIPGAVSYAARHPVDTVVAGYQRSKQSLSQATDALKAGNYDEALGHLSNAVPLMGPMIVSIHDDMQAGNWARAGARMSELIAAHSAPELMEKAGGAAAKVASNSPVAPERLYQSALKPPPGADNTAAVVKTGLQNGIPVSEAGVQKLSGLITDLNDSISKKIQAGGRAGATIDPNAVASRVGDVSTRFADQVNPVRDLKAIDASRQEFLDQQGAKPGQPAQPPQPTGILNAQGQPVMNQGTPATPATPAQPIPVEKAQALKVGTYRQMEGKYGELSSAQVETQKALARGIKEELNNVFPELKGMNAQEGELLDLQPALERAVRRHGNTNMVGIGTPIAAGAGGAVAGGPGAAVAAILKSAIDDPTVKSRLAINLYRATKASKTPLSAAQALAHVNAMSAMLGASQDQSEKQQQQPEGASYNLGDTVHLGDGKPLVIKKLNGDGTFEH